MKKTLLFLIPLCFLMLPFSWAGNARSIKGKPVYDDEIIIRLKDSFSREDSDGFIKKYGEAPATKERAAALMEKAYGFARTRKYLSNVPFFCYRVPDRSKLMGVLDELKKEGVIKYAHPNYRRYALYFPNDPVYTMSLPGYPGANQWGFRKVMADAAFNADTSANTFNALIDWSSNTVPVIVAVLDTGAGSSLLSPSVHPDLDGVTINGYNVLNPGSAPYDDDPDGGHGTHCSGIIGANTNNGTGMAGVAYRNSTWTAKILIMPVKVLDSTGSGADSDIYSGVVWAVDHGAKVLNMSFGGPDGSDTLQEAVNYAYNNGCVNVAAAGNDNSKVWFPAGYSTVISVAATDSNDIRADFSNFGKIDVSAPGVDVWSCANITSQLYTPESGTSFSSPHVAGLAALIVMKYPGITPDETAKIIEQTADDIDSQGYDKYTGWGRINVVRALTRNYSALRQVNTYNWPNPFSPEHDMFTNITFILTSPSDVSLTIYDGGGDIVWKNSVAAASTSAGQNFIKWNGINSSGKSVANGTYFYVLKANGASGKNKIMVMH